MILTLKHSPLAWQGFDSPYKVSEGHFRIVTDDAAANAGSNPDAMFHHTSSQAGIIVPGSLRKSDTSLKSEWGHLPAISEDFLAKDNGTYAVKVCTGRYGPLME